MVKIKGVIGLKKAVFLDQDGVIKFKRGSTMEDLSVINGPLIQKTEVKTISTSV